MGDVDLPGHLAFGRDIWETGRLVRQDPYSYLTRGTPWIDHEWLSEAVFFATYSLLGAWGLSLLKVSLYLLLAGLLYRHLRERDIPPIRAALLTLFPFLPLLHPRYVALRPDAFTSLFFTALLIRLEGGERSGGPAPAWTLGLFALWANLHGGFLAGLGALAVWTLVRRRGAAALAAAAGGTLLNPYGARLWGFLARTALGPRPEITEWRPLELWSPSGAHFLGLLLVCGLGWAFTRRERGRAQFVLLLCLSALPFIALRHTLLSALGLLILSGEHVGDAWRRLVPEKPEPRSGAAGSSFGSAVDALACAAFLFFGWRNLGCIGTQRLRWPREAMALLKESGISGNMAVDFAWGEYAIWHLGPRIKVSIDGRRETAYSPEVQGENLRFLRGTDGWSDLIDRPETDLVLVRRGAAAFERMEGRPEWALVDGSPAGGLFARKGSPLHGVLLKARSSMSPALPPACFPD
mgnify:CR=1 FL=1